jgi:hypothetical protein
MFGAGCRPSPRRRALVPRMQIIGYFGCLWSRYFAKIPVRQAPWFEATITNRAQVLREKERYDEENREEYSDRRVEDLQYK